MKKHLYLLIILITSLQSFTAMAQSDECDTRLYDFSPESFQRVIPVPPTAPPAPPITPNPERKRKIHWVHGLGGDKSSWIKATRYTTDNWGDHVTNNTIQYTELQVGDIHDAAQYVYDVLDPGKKNNPEMEEELREDFIIAHSLGGLVARFTEQKYENKQETVKPYGGIVTFGSPHLGAKLADIKINSPYQLEYFIKLACTELLAGPVKDLLTKNGLLKVLQAMLFWVDFDKIIESVCSLASSIGIEIAKISYSMPIEKILVPGNSDLEEVVNIPAPGSDLHSVAFYGEEFDDNDDMAIRFLFSLHTNSIDYPLMGADQMDDDALDLAHELLDKYTNKVESNNEVAKSMMEKALMAKSTSKKLEYYAYSVQAQANAAAWQRGVTWFDNLNDRWKVLIGSKGVVPSGETICYCYCVANDPNAPSVEMMYEVPCNTTCDQYLQPYTKCYNLEEPVFEFVNTTSDGLVTSESAMALPNPKYPPRLMKGSGHMQMKNDSELKKALDAIYNGDVDKYFKLDK